jgi:hypothetical protein
LYAAFIAILAGAQGLVELNKRLRADPVLLRAFGETGCAEQSVVQNTLDACTEENVAQLYSALDRIYQTHSRAVRHNYEKAYQLLDVDLSGQPCGQKAVFATKGYFAAKRGKRGRQLGRVLATRYNEIVLDRLFAGNIQLNVALKPLVETAETTLALTQARRLRTIVRIDAGAGSLDDLNWLLSRDYLIMAKDFSTTRAVRLAASVKTWRDDPLNPGRQVGLVCAKFNPYVRPVTRLAVRCLAKTGQGRYAVLITNLSEASVQAQLTEAGRSLPASVS